MIYVTGDKHGDIDFSDLNRKNFPEQKEMTKQDYVIICGDFGGVFYYPESKYYNSQKYLLKWYENKKFTTLFVDGNHENFTELAKYPIVEKFGGKVRQVGNSIFQLMRGEIYDIEGKKFFCFGGASSHDKYLRKENVDWWPDEIASREEMEYGVENLSKAENKVDYVITHCCSTDVQNMIGIGYEQDSMTQYFKFLDEEIEYKHWYFGHYHLDRKIDGKHTCMYHVKELLA